MGFLLFFEKSQKKEERVKNPPCIYNPPQPSRNYPCYQGSADMDSRCRFYSVIDVDGWHQNLEREGWSVFQPFPRLTVFEKVSCD